MRSPGRYVALYALSLIPRVAYAAWERHPFDGTYWALADSILEHGSLSINGQITTDFEPGYPLFIAVCRTIAGTHEPAVQGLQIAVAAWGGPLMYWLTARLSERPAAAVLGAVLYAFDPLLVRQAVQHSEASLTATLLLGFTCLFVAATTTRGAALAGAVLGLAVVTRAMTAPLVLAGALIWIASRRYRAALAFTAAALFVVAPFGIRNVRLNGSWMPTRGGLNLFVGNHPYAAALMPTYDVDRLERLANETVSSRAGTLSDGPERDRLADRILTDEALAYMSAAPLRTAAQKVRNVFYFFSPQLIPFRTGGSRVVATSGGRITVEDSEARPRMEIVVYTTFYSVVLAAAAGGVYLRRGRFGSDALLWCIAGTFVVVYSIYFPATRYRGPMTFVILFYAAVALERAISASTRRAAFRPAIQTTAQAR